MAFIEIEHLSKTFSAGDAEVTALRDVTLHIERGEAYGIIGLSGAGKSTLVRCINLLERPEQGRLLFDGQDLLCFDEKQLRIRRRKIAMIFQNFNLLEQRSVLENVLFPMELAGVKRKEAKRRALELLQTVGLPDKANVYPAQLSGGQKQRVAIARAIACEPQVLLCDEATSALDPETTQSILALLRSIRRERGITLIVITHQMSVIEQVCDRVAILDHGAVVEQGSVQSVFSAPKSEIGRRLVSPDRALPPSHRKGATARIAFDGIRVEEPIIAALALQKGILVSILGADTREIDGKMFGTMLVALPEDALQRSAALDFFNAYEGVCAEEV